MMLRMLVLAGALALSWSAPAADRVMLLLAHEYVDFVDRGVIQATFQIWPAESRFECLRPSTDVRNGNRIVLTSIGGDQAQGAENCGSQTHAIGTLAVGAYEVTARVLRPDGTLLAENTQALHVAPFGGRCNPTPDFSRVPVVNTILKFPMRGADVAARLSTDPRFTAAIGSPASIHIGPIFDGDGNATEQEGVNLRYHPLFNLVEAREQIANAFPWSIDSYDRGGYCYNTSNEIKANIEYLYPGLDHYFYANDPDEINKLDANAGAVGGAWQRTGKSFSAATSPNCVDGQSVVYRFWSIPGAGASSHFFTRDAAECSVVHKSEKWIFEGVAFWASQPNADGMCNPLQNLGQDRIPLYRAWRPFGSSTHRLSTDRAVINEMVAKGWVDEGAVMCVLPPS